MKRKKRNERNAGRKHKFSEESVIISFRVPKSQAAKIKKLIQQLIQKETNKNPDANRD